ncbi:hypothetical protein PoB_000038300 [Plakobranchus ocellatus]|uniref:Uncharacterized protein n=1 Tax=Plakobranchus ocellatus TaxID=259542 RepID=A0AAV3XTX2_9GAST|nr:hypothetical protein PoB_000038300 [Plakobranchus ocellatus]
MSQDSTGGKGSNRRMSVPVIYPPVFTGPRTRREQQMQEEQERRRRSQQRIPAALMNTTTRASLLSQASLPAPDVTQVGSKRPKRRRIKFKEKGRTREKRKP